MGFESPFYLCASVGHSWSKKGCSITSLVNRHLPCLSLSWFPLWALPGHLLSGCWGKSQSPTTTKVQLSSKCGEDLQGTLALQCPQGSLCLCSDCLPLSSHWGDPSERSPKGHFGNSLSPEEGEAWGYWGPDHCRSVLYVTILDKWVDIGKRNEFENRGSSLLCSSWPCTPIYITSLSWYQFSTYRVRCPMNCNV